MAKEVEHTGCGGCDLTPKPETIFQEAERTITHDRQDQYGSPEDCFSDIAKGWAVILEVEVTPAQVAQCMIWLKVAREKYRHKRDNIVDLMGYAGCLARIVGEK